MTNHDDYDDYDDNEDEPEQTTRRRRHGILWMIFCGPGALSLWLRYYNPSSYMDVVRVDRQRGSSFWLFLHSMGVYAGILIVVVFLLGVMANIGHH